MTGAVGRTSARDGASILVATYNGAAWLRDQLDTILAQAAPEDEVIVVDDGSSDATLAILADYADRHPALSIVRNPVNLGVRGTFEALLRLCTRPIVFLSDQDDLWIEGRKAAMMAALDEDRCVAVLANSRILTRDGMAETFFPEHRDPDVRSVRRNFVHNNFIGCCMAFRREVLDVALPFPATISMHDWWIGTCAMATGKVRYLAAPSLLYRRHDSNQAPRHRRRWRVVMRDRVGNLVALVVLAARLARRRNR